ncbi:hypothetical protein EAF00_010075 [Botryotinia globosa]|nr:hypothetical protein EAF00_010075 [Botryotinia globosa]
MRLLHQRGLGGIYLYEPSVIGEFYQAIMPLLESGKLHVSVPMQVYGISEVQDVFRCLQSGTSMGKIVIEMKETDMVPVSYFNVPFSGGLGRLGRNIALWMANRGARSLILLSPTQRQNHSDAAKSVLARLAEQGVQVTTPACDISDFEQLRSSREICKYMPPIRVCIQGSMVVCDSTFANMALDANAAVKPKVDGTWNLHKALPNGMDFFIMLASIAGVRGIHGQANYACGNTYQDEFARYRCQLGEKAVSFLRSWYCFKYLPAIRVSESELCAVLDYYCDLAASTDRVP